MRELFKIKKIFLSLAEESYANSNELNFMTASVEDQLLYVECFFFILQLLVVMDRIRSFPLSSPLSKFLNGLEILLAKAQVRKGLRETFFSFVLPLFILVL